VSAVAAIERLNPDLVFLDVQMPEMDGFAVVERSPRRALLRYSSSSTALTNTPSKPSKFALSTIFSSLSIANDSTRRWNRGRTEIERHSGGDFDRRLRTALSEWQKHSQFLDRLVIKSGDASSSYASAKSTGSKARQLRQAACRARGIPAP